MIKDGYGYDALRRATEVGHKEVVTLLENPPQPLAENPVPVMVRRSDPSAKASQVAESRGMFGP